MAATLVAVAAVSVFLLGGGGEADATPTRIAELVAICESPCGMNRKTRACAQLCEIDTGAARNALVDLCDSDDVVVATVAMGALARQDFSGAERKLKDVLEDTERSDPIRCSALAAYCSLRKDGGSGWSNVRSYVEDEADGDAELEDMAEALRTGLFGEEE